MVQSRSKNVAKVIQSVPGHSLVLLYLLLKTRNKHDYKNLYDTEHDTHFVLIKEIAGTTKTFSFSFSIYKTAKKINLFQNKYCFSHTKISHHNNLVVIIMNENMKV